MSIGGLDCTNAEMKVLKTPSIQFLVHCFEANAVTGKDFEKLKDKRVCNSQSRLHKGCGCGVYHGDFGTVNYTKDLATIVLFDGYGVHHSITNVDSIVHLGRLQ